MDRGPIVDIIMLNLNQEQDLIESISSLRDMEYNNYRILLVDNGSTDNSGFHIKERFANIEFLRSEENIGFTGGCNLGIKHSLKSGLASYILLLNSDTKVEENLLGALLEVAQKDERIGVVGAVSYYYFMPDKVHSAGNKFIWPLGIQRRVSTIKSEFEEVQSASGCCMLIKREAVEKIGLLDEKFFAYYEEADFCLRAKRNDFKVVVARDAKVWHKINKTLGSKTYQEYYIYTRNQPLFMLKNCPKIFLPNYFVVYFLKVFVRIIYFSVTFRRAMSKAVLNGFVDFFKGNFGKGRLFGKD